MKKKTLIIIGLLSFAFGAIGTVLPVLPTTPFLLLSAACFSRSSDRFDRWLKGTRLYAFYVKDYKEKGYIPKKKKVKIWMNIIILMGISIFLAPITWVKWLLVGLTIFLFIMLFFYIPSGPGNQNEG